jgi:hypothetical protein
MNRPRRFEPDQQRDDTDRGPDCVPDEGRHPDFRLGDDPFARHHELQPVPPFCEFPEGPRSPDIELYDLIDYTVQVGTTGINFVAGLTGWRESDGTALFIPGAVDAAVRRAASTLAWMALISGQTFQFLRLSLGLSVDQTAELVGVTPSTITDWEDGTLPVGVQSWQCLADAALKADGRAGITYTPLPAPDFRPRTIRIFPDVPGAPQPPAPPCPPCGTPPCGNPPPCPPC